MHTPPTPCRPSNRCGLLALGCCLLTVVSNFDPLPFGYFLFLPNTYHQIGPSPLQQSPDDDDDEMVNLATSTPEVRCCRKPIRGTWLGEAVLGIISLVPCRVSSVDRGPLTSAADGERVGPSGSGGPLRC